MAIESCCALYASEGNHDGLCPQNTWYARIVVVYWGRREVSRWLSREHRKYLISALGGDLSAVKHFEERLRQRNYRRIE